MNRTIITTAGLAIAGLSLTACNGTVAKATAPATPASSASSSAPAAQASPTPSSAPLTGPVGTTYQVTGANGPNGENTVYSVTLVEVEQQATLTQYESLTDGSDHVTAAKFTITGKTGDSSDDADSDAVAVGIRPAGLPALVRFRHRRDELRLRRIQCLAGPDRDRLGLFRTGLRDLDRFRPVVAWARRPGRDLDRQVKVTVTRSGMSRTGPAASRRAVSARS